MGMIDYLITGITLGFVAGISPGPILTLVISETVKYSRREGFKIAMTPLMTDLPIMIFTIFVAFKFSNFDVALGIISLLGAVFILFLAFENIRIKSVQVSLDDVGKKTYRKGIVANFLSPHPYLFWLLVGAPFTIKAYNYHPVAAVLFIAGFYIFIVGTKIVIAFISEKSKNVLSSKYYIFIIRALGIALLVFSIILIKDGLKFLDII